jgi:tetratricopeptide (TPR) repeat protein
MAMFCESRGMRSSILAMFALALCAAPSLAQSNSDVAPACRPDASGAVNYQACVDGARPGALARILALINLGTIAYKQQNITDAVRLYDQADAEARGNVYSDAGFHAYRADAYARAGRPEDALTNARIAWQLMTHDRVVSPQLAHLAAEQPVDPETVYGLILPILKQGNDPHFNDALAAFNALPESDWISYANHSAVLDQLGDHQGALRENTRALALAPNEPGALNNQCYVLAELGRGAEALAYCEHALQLAPDAASILDSYATALAVAGRCDEANRQRARAHEIDPVAVNYQKPLTCTLAAH